MTNSFSENVGWKFFCLVSGVWIIGCGVYIVLESLRKKLYPIEVKKMDSTTFNRTCVVVCIKGVMVSRLLEVHEAFLVVLPRPSVDVEAGGPADLLRRDCGVLLKCGHVISLGLLAPWPAAADSRCSTCFFHIQNPLDMLQILRDHVEALLAALQVASKMDSGIILCPHWGTSNAEQLTIRNHSPQAMVSVSFERTVERLKDSTCAFIEIQNAYTVNLCAFDGDRSPDVEMLGCFRKLGLQSLRASVKSNLLASFPFTRLFDFLAIEKMRQDLFLHNYADPAPLINCYPTAVLQYADAPLPASVPPSLVLLNSHWHLGRNLVLLSTSFRLFCEIVQTLSDFCTLVSGTYTLLQNIELVRVDGSDLPAADAAVCMVCLEPAESPSPDDRLVVPPCECTFLRFHRNCLLKILGANAGLCKRCQVRCIPHPNTASSSSSDPAEFCDIMVSCAVIMAIFLAFPEDIPLACYYNSKNDARETSAQMRLHLSQIIDYARFLNSSFLAATRGDQMLSLVDSQGREFFETFFAEPASSLLDSFCGSMERLYADSPRFTTSELELQKAYNRFSGGNLKEIFDNLVVHLNDAHGTRKAIFKVLFSINEANSLRLT